MNKDLKSLFGAVKIFLWRYHLTMFIVVAVSGVALAIFSLLNVITASGSATEFAADEAGFDQETIERVKNLNDTPNYTFSLPTDARNNPFKE